MFSPCFPGCPCTLEHIPPAFHYYIHILIVRINSNLTLQFVSEEHTHTQNFGFWRSISSQLWSSMKALHEVRRFVDVDLNRQFSESILEDLSLQAF